MYHIIKIYPSIHSHFTGNKESYIVRGQKYYSIFSSCSWVKTYVTDIIMKYFFIHSWKYGFLFFYFELTSIIFKFEVHEISFNLVIKLF